MSCQNTPNVRETIHNLEGNRIAEYLYDEVAGTSSLIREYIWANGALVGVYENGEMYYVRTDHIGRPVFATDSTGAKVWEASYGPFGGVTSTLGPNPELRFPGQWFQSETALHQNWMRDYDPTLGRYLQADPLGLVDGASVYGYVLQNPGRYTDSRGLNREIPYTLPNSPDQLDQYWVPSNPLNPSQTFTRTCNPNQTLQFHPGSPGLPPPQGLDHWHYFRGPTPNNRTKYRPGSSSTLNKNAHLYPGFVVEVTDCSCDGDVKVVPVPLPFPRTNPVPRFGGGGLPHVNPLPDKLLN